MATAILILDRPGERPGRDTLRHLGATRGTTNGAPCLGLALAAGGLAWGALGAFLALLLP